MNNRYHRTKKHKLINKIISFLLMFSIIGLYSFVFVTFFGFAEDKKEDIADKSGVSEFLYENDECRVAVYSSQEAIPKGAELHVREIEPSRNIKEAQIYSEALKLTSENLEKGKRLSSAKVYDINFTNESGDEIEPAQSVDVSIEYKKTLGFTGTGKNGSGVSVAHVKDNKQVEQCDAEAETTGKDNLKSIEFSADSFSLYVVFDTETTSNLQPISAGEYGWIRFGGNIDDSYNYMPGQGFDNAGWMKYLNVKLYKLKSGKSSSSRNPADYDLKKSYKYLKTWDQYFEIEDKRLTSPVLWTSFEKAHGITYNYESLENRYEGGTCYGVWHPWGFDTDDNVLNIYTDSTENPEPPQPQGTSYIVRYYHADGSYNQKNGTLSQGETFAVNQNDKVKDGETYSGVTVTAGNKAVNNLNETGGTATIRYDDGIHLVKINVYYKEKLDKQTGGPVAGMPQYDSKVENGEKIYDTSRDGLHTEKTATVHEDGQGNTDGRTFDLTLESWNIGENIANVGMVFDASGSMVWTSDSPEKMHQTRSEWQTLIGNYNDFGYLSQQQVDAILNNKNTDNSRLNYNGYKYYLYDYTANVREFVPMGYSDGNTGGDNTVIMDGHKMATWRYSGVKGWYYINSGGYPEYATREPYSAKQYVGVPKKITRISSLIQNRMLIQGTLCGHQTVIALCSSILTVTGI